MTKTPLGLHLTESNSKVYLRALVISTLAGVVTFAQRIPPESRWPATRGSMLAAGAMPALCCCRMAVSSSLAESPIKVSTFLAILSRRGPLLAGSDHGRNAQASCAR
jgi:hypothetical protein